MTAVEIGPRVLAALLIAAALAIHVVQRRCPIYADRWRASARGARFVIYGCYATVLLALNFPAAVSPILPYWAQWTGVVIATLGVGGLFAAVNQLRHGRQRTALDSQWLRYSAYADVLVWSGSSAALANASVLCAVGVALVAAYTFEVSADYS